MEKKKKIEHGVKEISLWGVDKDGIEKETQHGGKKKQRVELTKESWGK